MLNPEVYYKDQAVVDKLEVESVKKEPTYYPSSRKEPVKRTEGMLSANLTSTAELIQNSANTKSRKDFKDYIDDLLEKTASKKSIHKIMQRENDLYDHGEEDEDKKKDDTSCYQIISRITNTYKKGIYAQTI